MASRNRVSLTILPVLSLPFRYIGQRLVERGGLTHKQVQEMLQHQKIAAVEVLVPLDWVLNYVILNIEY